MLKLLKNGVSRQLPDIFNSSLPTVAFSSIPK